MGTGSGPTDLPSILADAVEKDAVQDEVDWETEEEEEEEEVEAGTGSGRSDARFGDGRAPTEAAWGLENLPERVEQSMMAFLVRKKPRSKPEEPRVNVSLVKSLGWTL